MVVNPPKTSQAEQDLINQQAAGTVRNGTVDLRVFDEGVVTSLGGEIVDKDYWLILPDVPVPSDLPGVPITFAYPEEIIEKYRIPAVIVRRDDMYPAMQRWHPGQLSYRVPAFGANPVSVNIGNVTKTGYDRYEERFQAMPFDIMYTISVVGRTRGGPGRSNPGLVNQSNRILAHVLQRFPPYGRLVVKDFEGNERSYEAFMEGVGMVDSTPEVGYRVTGFSVTLRIEAEWDLDVARERTAVTSPIVQNITKKLIP